MEIINTIFILSYTTSKSHLCRGVPTRSFKVRIEYGGLFLCLIVAIEEYPCEQAIVEEYQGYRMTYQSTSRKMGFLELSQT